MLSYTRAIVKITDRNCRRMLHDHLGGGHGAGLNLTEGADILATVYGMNYDDTVRNMKTVARNVGIKEGKVVYQIDKIFPSQVRI